MANEATIAPASTTPTSARTLRSRVGNQTVQSSPISAGRASSHGTRHNTTEMPVNSPSHSSTPGSSSTLSVRPPPAASNAGVRRRASSGPHHRARPAITPTMPIWNVRWKVRSAPQTLTSAAASVADPTSNWATATTPTGYARAATPATNAAFHRPTSSIIRPPRRPAAAG